MCPISLPSPGDKGSDVQANSHDYEQGASNSNDGEYHNRRYERASLLNVWVHLDIDAATRASDKFYLPYNNLPKLIPYRELLDSYDQNGRYISSKPYKIDKEGASPYAGDGVDLHARFQSQLCKAEGRIAHSTTLTTPLRRTTTTPLSTTDSGSTPNHDPPHTRPRVRHTRVRSGGSVAAPERCA